MFLDWEEARLPREKPGKHEESMLTPHGNLSVFLPGFEPGIMMESLTETLKELADAAHYLHVTTISLFCTSLGTAVG